MLATLEIATTISRSLPSTVSGLSDQERMSVLIVGFRGAGDGWGGEFGFQFEDAGAGLDVGVFRREQGDGLVERIRRLNPGRRFAGRADHVHAQRLAHFVPVVHLQFARLAGSALGRAFHPVGIQGHLRIHRLVAVGRLEARLIKEVHGLVIDGDIGVAEH